MRAIHKVVCEHSDTTSERASRCRSLGNPAVDVRNYLDIWQAATTSPVKYKLGKIVEKRHWAFSFEDLAFETELHTLLTLDNYWTQTLEASSDSDRFPVEILHSLPLVLTKAEYPPANWLTDVPAGLRSTWEKLALEAQGDHITRHRLQNMRI